MRTTASYIAIILVLAFMLALSVIAYIEAWNAIRSMEGLMDSMVKALASCLFILLSILLAIAAALTALTLFLLPSPLPPPDPTSAVACKPSDHADY